MGPVRLAHSVQLLQQLLAVVAVILREVVLVGVPLAHLLRVTAVAPEVQVVGFIQEPEAEPQGIRAMEVLVETALPALARGLAALPVQEEAVVVAAVVAHHRFFMAQRAVAA